jgi:myotubularin-related protein 1/2
LRSSQPKTGLTNASSPEDREYLRHCQSGLPLAILDCRPKLNAVANQFTGGGYEDISGYANATFEFLGIPNIHKVRECYLGMLDSFGLGKKVKHGERAWKALTVQLLAGAQLGAEKLKGSVAVLVHCTDGWDRTAQICGLIEVILEPRARTFAGFETLVQREWCDLGHMFGLRCCHAERAREMDQSAPIFAQFIDAMLQLVKTYENAFEFNRHFLTTLLFHAYSQLYGDFLGTCYKERVEMERPASFWQYLRDDEFRGQFVNAAYCPIDGEIDARIPTYHVNKSIFAVPVFGGGVACLPQLAPEFDPNAVEHVSDSIPTRRETVAPEESRDEDTVPLDSVPSIPSDSSDDPD